MTMIFSARDQDELRKAMALDAGVIRRAARARLEAVRVKADADAVDVVPRALIPLRNRASVLLALRAGAEAWGAILDRTELADSVFGRIMRDLVGRGLVRVTPGPNGPHGPRRYAVSEAGHAWLAERAAAIRELGLDVRAAA